MVKLLPGPFRTRETQLGSVRLGTEAGLEGDGDVVVRRGHLAAFDGEDVGFGRLGSESEDVASAVGVRVDRQFPDGLAVLELHVDAFVISRNRGVVGGVVGIAEEAGGGGPVGRRLPGTPRTPRRADPGEIRRDRRPAGQADQQRGSTERRKTEDGIAWAKPPLKENGPHPPHEVCPQCTGTQGSGQGWDTGQFGNPERFFRLQSLFKSRVLLPVESAAAPHVLCPPPSNAGRIRSVGVRETGQEEAECLLLNDQP